MSTCVVPFRARGVQIASDQNRKALVFHDQVLDPAAIVVYVHAWPVYVDRDQNCRPLSNVRDHRHYLLRIVAPPSRVNLQLRESSWDEDHNLQHYLGFAARRVLNSLMVVLDVAAQLQVLVVLPAELLRS